MRQFDCDFFTVDILSFVQTRGELTKLYGGFDILNCYINEELFLPWTPRQGNVPNINCSNFEDILQNTALVCNRSEFSSILATTISNTDISLYGWKGSYDASERNKVALECQ
jgi:hypothetical protein